MLICHQRIVELQHLRCGMIQHLGPHLQTSQRKTISWTLGVNLSCEQTATTATCPAFGVQSEAKAGVVATTNLQPSLYASLSLSLIYCVLYTWIQFIHTTKARNQIKSLNPPILVWGRPKFGVISPGRPTVDCHLSVFIGGEEVETC